MDVIKRVGILGLGGGYVGGVVNPGYETPVVRELHLRSDKDDASVSFYLSRAKFVLARAIEEGDKDLSFRSASVDGNVIRAGDYLLNDREEGFIARVKSVNGADVVLAGGVPRDVSEGSAMFLVRQEDSVKLSVGKSATLSYPICGHVGCPIGIELDGAKACCVCGVVDMERR